MNKEKGFRLSMEEYQKACEAFPRPCLDALIIIPNPEDPKQTCFVMILRSHDPYRGYWAFPGGRIGKGETFEECVKRILREELGLKIESGINMEDFGPIEYLDDGKTGATTIHSISNVFVIRLPKSVSFSIIPAHSTNIGYFNKIPRDIHPVQGKFLRRKQEKLDGLLVNETT